MKLSAATLEILKNFASINTNILIRTGNTLRTITVAKNIFAVAQVEEDFPQEFAIYDLNSFLALASLMGEDDEVNFGDKALTISKGDGKFEYYYADPTIITAAPDKDLKLDSVFKFTLAKSDVEMLIKAAAIVKAPTINIVSRKGKVTLSVGDPDTPGSNSYKRVVGKSSADFDCRLAIENFRVIAADYEVSLSSSKVMVLKNKDKKLSYFLALDPKSTLSKGGASDDEPDEEEEAPAPKAKSKAKAAPAPEPEEDEDEEEDLKALEKAGKLKKPTGKKK